MDDTSNKLNPMKPRDVAYYKQRQKNRVFTALVKFISEEAERRGISKKQLAETLGRDPSQITRWLNAPSNFELDTLSEILLAFDAEMDHSIVRFKDRPRANYTHPAIAPYVGALPFDKPRRAEPSATTATVTKPFIVKKSRQNDRADAQISVDARVKVSVS